MADQPAAGFPDYFSLFQSLFAPGGSAQSASASMMAMLDPKELERKISETETVLAWLKTTTSVVEISVQTMKQQHALLTTMAAQRAMPESAPKTEQPGMDQLVSAMNPANWALQMMQASAPKAEEPANTKRHQRVHPKPKKAAARRGKI